MPDSPRKRMHKRTHSDEYITGLLGSDPKRNRNVEWLNTPYLLPAYIFFIALFYGAVRGTELVDAGGAWAFTNAVHGGLTFVVLHWWKGSPDEFSQGEFNGQTLWEQIDGAVPSSQTKNLLLLVPTVLVLIASIATNYEVAFLPLNLMAWAVLCLFPKLPMMHGVRMFGINSTPGIDR